MSKKILLIASSCFLLLSFSKNAVAQIEPELFKLPDTVCTDNEITPLNVVDGFDSYTWTFCPPELFNAPNGISDSTYLVDNPTSIAMAKEGNVDYSFVLNSNSGLIRYTFNDGYFSAPTQTTPLGFPTNANGMYAVKSDVWKVFVVSNAPTGFKLIRYDFPNGLIASSVQTDLGTISSAIPIAKKIYIVQEDNNWYGFSFTDSDALLRLSFGNDLNSVPTVTNLGNIHNQFSGASGMAAIREFGNWHLFVTNQTKDNLVRVSFGNTLENTPFVINLGNLSGRIKNPVGIAITKGCDAYYGYVLNKGTASFVALKWDNQSIANPPVSTNHGNIAGFNQPLCMSGIVEDSGGLYLFGGNTSHFLSKMEFAPCTTSSIASSNDEHPIFSYSEPGVKTVYLTVNQGLPNVTTSCSQMYVYPHTSITISNDTLICQSDTIKLSILTFAADSFIWTPNYKIDTLKGQFVHVSPEFSTKYVVTVYYAPNCIVHKPIQVNVSNIQADAGEDRIISDGSATILGGPKTTIGSQFTYLWTPDIGFEGGSTGDRITKVIPPYDLTYYLTVTNTDGCRAIDSVNVHTPCDKINMPNAFNPESSSTTSNTFGVSNLQFAKINYFRVFDRWGKEVFNTVDPNQRWDGNVDGKKAAMGNYVWELDANCQNTGERFRQSGTVMLIR